MRFISNCNNNGFASNKKLQNEMDELTNQLGNTQEDLAKERNSRGAADLGLQSQIDTEVTARQNADSSLRSSIETDKQDLADYKTALANSVSTKTVNATSVTTEDLAANNSAFVGNQLSIQKRGNINSGTVIKTFDNVYVPDSNNWYLLAQWPQLAIPEIECVFGGMIAGGFKITPEVIETKGNGKVQIALGVQRDGAILAIKGSCETMSFVARYNKAYGFTAYTSSLTTTVAESDIQSTFTVDGHVYLNNFAVPNDISVRNHVFANNVISEEANFTKEKVTTSNIAILENSKRNIKKDYITLDTHQTNTRYYIRLPKFNGTYTCTLVKDDRQLFSLEVLEHGDYVELNYSSIDANDATVDSYLEEFWLDKYGMLYFKTFGDGKLYYSYNAEGELPAPESYSSLPISGDQIKADYVSHAFTEKVILQGQIGTTSIGTTSGANMLIAIWTGTQEEYDAMPVTDPNTLYLIEE